LKLDKLEGLYTDEIEDLLVQVTDERLFVVAEALRRGFSPQKINHITKMDIWFLEGFQRIIDMENELERCKGVPSADTLKRAKEMCFADSYIGTLCGMKQAEVKALREKYGIVPSFKMVDTCAAEFDAETPYYYSSYDGENEAVETSDRKKVLVLGSGPIRIGQGIEFDYCSVHSVWAFKRMGFETIIINNNPETVSTDFDVADKLYFEPLTAEDVQNIVEQEKPWGAVVQFGGQTAIKLAKALTEMGIQILGTSADGVDAAEDRERFDEILEKCGIPRAKGRTVFTTQEALQAANELGYPVLVRPSYVLGGQGMEIAYNDRNIEDFMKIINMTVQEHPILIDKYLMGRELEVDGVFDGEDILIPGIMEHVERAGVHSGDSIAVYPPINLEDKHRELILKHTKNMAKHLNVIGLINAQYILYNDDIYVIEVNPRSSRTIPYISKVTGVPIIDLATKVMLGQKLKDLGYGTGIYKEADYYAVKAPVFSFEKLTDVDTGLGPEMKSTGEVLGLAETYPQALLKAFKGCGLRVPKRGSRIIVTVKDEDKPEMIGIARGFEEMGIEIYATSGTCDALTAAGIACKRVNRVSQSHPNILDMIQSGTVDLIINTPTKGRKHDSDGFKIRRSAVEHSVACVTAIDTARAVLTVREQSRSEDLTPIDITKI
ncbi:MAG: carbamoyl-phosphate synthase large subunit, partial [Oscillospiraceae bacterium]|nr:carbamoyl-phosphate synthase large subunit [Oscillospiraceae bacterium]